MDKQLRSTGLFAAGAIAAGLVIVAAYLGWFAPKASSLPPRAPDVTAVAPAPAEPPAAVQATALASSCPSQALAPATDAADGRFALQAALASGPHANASAFLAVAQEAAGQGRLRDTEVALLAACHVAEQASGRASAPLADVKSQLGQHYVLLASREGAEPARDSLLQRASALFADSASTYAAALGRNASKTRLAEERLAAVNSPDPLRASASVPETATLGAASPTYEAINPVPALVQSDPELAQLDRDLQRLQAQAATVSRDPDGLRRRDAQALAQRDARCQDKACLRQWYGLRRAQLLGEF